MHGPAEAISAGDTMKDQGNILRNTNTAERVGMDRGSFFERAY